MKKIIPVFICAAFHLSVLPAQHHAQEENGVAQTAIELTHLLAAAWEALDTEKYMEYFSPELDFYIEGVRIGYDDLEKMVKQAARTLERTTFEVIDPLVSLAGRDNALITFRLKETFLGRDGQYEEVNGAMTLHWHYQEEEWKVILAHESFPNPVPGEKSHGQ